ncbi:DUF2516 family protein [Isoptericola sp. b441]|uniref:DUF2516 family protein n=1 Tax=Actinotalea lenta TaxID=3064654 RepID=A0ABT9D6J7_9CELL|nr:MULTISPECIES: DUF2516 family protein [unclassified Isoptericola]MDO8106441.1 DUF2516 family protein [Isoptericola sp. b441]MDO8121843.1 DUF2516 family protein [Isoptericola sp. b490]
MIRTAQLLVFGLLYLAVFVFSLLALIDAARRPSQAFVAAGKRTKGFWVGVTGACTAVSFAAMPPLGAPLGFLVLIAAVGAIVYLVDVRPALGSGPRRPGPRRSGGW